MPNNKIRIGVGKQDKDDKTQRISNDELYNPSIMPAESEPSQEQEHIYDDAWGNDSILDKQLDKDYLNEKRRYVRVRYIQKIECSSICENSDMDFVVLNRPIILTMSDISMGGIGAVCDKELNKGSVLEFDIILDNIRYCIKCEVVYCIFMEESYRIGFRIINKERDFVKHLKILVARISLHAAYGHNNSK